jgi:HSP20 family protein
MSLMRRNPYDPFFDFDQAMSRMRDRMRSMMESPLAPFEGEETLGDDVNMLAVDMTSDDDHIIVRTMLPGFKDDEVDVDVRGNMLTITAESRTEREDKQANWHMRELRYGKFSRSVVLPEQVSADKADASLENGVLTVKLPKEKPSAVQKIAVKARNLLKANGTKK